MSGLVLDIPLKYVFLYGLIDITLEYECWFFFTHQL